MADGVFAECSRGAARERAALPVSVLYDAALAYSVPQVLTMQLAASRPGCTGFAGPKFHHRQAE